MEDWSLLGCDTVLLGERFSIFFKALQSFEVGRDSSVSITTGYRLDGPGIKPLLGGKIFRTCPYRPWGPPSLLLNGYRFFPGGKERPGRDADPSPPSSAVVKKG